MACGWRERAGRLGDPRVARGYPVSSEEENPGELGSGRMIPNCPASRSSGPPFSILRLRVRTGKGAREGGPEAAKVAPSYQFQHLVVATVGWDLGILCCLPTICPIFLGIADVWLDGSILLQDVCLLPPEISGSF